jgi:hypothetical protein
LGAVSFVLGALLLAPWGGRNSADGEISAHRVMGICVLRCSEPSTSALGGGRARSRFEVLFLCFLFFFVSTSGGQTSDGRVSLGKTQAHRIIGIGNSTFVRKPRGSTSDLLLLIRVFRDRFCAPGVAKIQRMGHLDHKPRLNPKPQTVNHEP